MGFAYTIVSKDDMEKGDKHMTASLLFNSQMNQSWWAKIGDVFLSRFSANYPAFYNAGQHKSGEEMTVGYEAAWVGIAREVTKNNKMH